MVLPSVLVLVKERAFAVVVDEENVVLEANDDDNADAVNFFRRPRLDQFDDLTSTKPGHGLRRKGLLGIPGVKRDVERGVRRTTDVFHTHRDRHRRSGCNVVVGQRDGGHAQFWTDGTKPHPLALEVGVVLGQFGNRAGL